MMGPSALVLVASVVVACVPLGVWVIFLRWLGRGDRELRRVLRSVFLFGATFGTFFGLLASGALSYLVARLTVWPVGGPLLEPRLAALLDALLASPLAEEGSKGLVLLLLLRARALCSRVSGLIYGGTVGLGFAVAENLASFLQTFTTAGGEAWRDNLVIRTLFAAWMHVAASAACGLWPGLAREVSLPGWKRQLAPLLGLGTAWLLHALWNATLFLSEASDDHQTISYLFAAVPLVAALLLYLLERSLRAEAQVAQAELSREAEAGLFPSAHAAIVSSYRARRGRAWLPPALRARRDAYVQALLRLSQCTRAARAAEAEGDEQRAAPYRSEAEDLRQQLRVWSAAHL